MASFRRQILLLQQYNAFLPSLKRSSDPSLNLKLQNLRHSSHRPLRLLRRPFACSRISQASHQRFLSSSKSSISAGRGVSQDSEWKEWLVAELWLASKIIGYGCLAITAYIALTYIGKHAQLEYTNPTPKEYSWQTRAALRAARHAADWERNYDKAVWYLDEAIKRLDAELDKKGGWDAVGEEWRNIYLKTLCQLGDIEQALRKFDESRMRWEKLLAIADKHLTTDMKIKSRLKIGEILDEELTPEVPNEKGGNAEMHFKEAYALALQEVGVNPSEVDIPGMLPTSIPPTPNILNTATEIAIHYARHEQLDLALPIFLSIYRASTQSAPESKSDLAPHEAPSNPISDVCPISKIMSYIGEILFASGQQSEGLSWTRRAVFQAGPLAEIRASCRETAVHAAQNEVIMLRKMIEEEKLEPRVSKFKANQEGKGEGGWPMWRKKVLETEEKRNLEGELREAEERLVALSSIRVSKGK